MLYVLGVGEVLSNPNATSGAIVSGSVSIDGTVEVTGVSAGDVKVSLDSEKVVLDTGTAVVGGAKFVDEAGALYGVKHVQNKPRVSSMPYTYDIAEKNITGHTAWSKIGFHAAVTTEQDVRPYAAVTAGIGWTYTFPTAELTMTIVSDSAKDCKRALTAFAAAPAPRAATHTVVTCAGHGLANADTVIIAGTTSYNGTFAISSVAAPNTFEITKAFVADDATGTVRGPGANTVTVYYLDDGFVEKSATVTLLGTTPVNIATDMYRVNNVRVSTAGTGGVPVGTLVVASGGQQYGGISAGKTRARQMIYTVPILKSLFITDIYFSVQSMATGKYARFTLVANYDEKADTVLDRWLFMPFKELVLANAPYNRSLTMPIYYPATTDIKMRCFADATCVISCGLTGWLETA